MGTCRPGRWDTAVNQPPPRVLRTDVPVCHPGSLCEPMWDESGQRRWAAGGIQQNVSSLRLHYVSSACRAGQEPEGIRERAGGPEGGQRAGERKRGAILLCRRNDSCQALADWPVTHTALLSCGPRTTL